MNIKHNRSLSPEYEAWHKMKQRCYNLNDPSYSSYGARGIIVCDRWLNSFSNFLEDIGPKPFDDYTLDRINNDGNYTPDNCQWSSKSQQAYNRRPKELVKGLYRRGENHARSKLTEAEIREIKESFLKKSTLAKQYSVSYQTISRIKNNETWKHVS